MRFRSLRVGFVGNAGLAILLLLLSVSCASLPLARYGYTSRPPNIIFIMADDLGYGELGCYGQEKILTPNIDRLAAEGLRFTQCYSGSCVCAPSRSVLMTGLHTGHTPIRENGPGKYLVPEDVTVAEVVKQAGYVTGCFGKWGLGVEGTTGHPNRQGFDDFFGQLHQRHAHFYYPFFLWKNETKFYMPENEGRKRVRYAEDEIHFQAVDFIRRNKDRPMFCYIPYIIPHAEFVAPEDSMKLYRGKFKEVKPIRLKEGYIQTDEPCATLAAMITRMDSHVGEIMALLKELGIDDNTIVFFTSDNGPDGYKASHLTNFFKGSGPFRGHKFTFYEGGIRVPMIARWPERIKAGTVTDHVCAFWDFLPTAAEITGGKPPKDIDGISFVPTLLGKGKQKEHEYLYWERGHHRVMNQVVRMGDWKLIHGKKKDIYELYNLKDDIGEARNVVAKHPKVLARMKGYMQTARTEERKWPNLPQPSWETYVR